MLKGLGFDRWTAQEQFQRQDKQCCSLQWSRYQCAGAVVMQLGLLSFCLFAAKIVVRGGLVSNRWVPETQRKHLALTICTTIIRYNNGEINICYFESSGAHGMDDCWRRRHDPSKNLRGDQNESCNARTEQNEYFFLFGRTQTTERRGTAMYYQQSSYHQKSKMIQYMQNKKNYSWIWNIMF